MDQLSQALQAAAGDPPPTRIDLDQLIDGERRRARLQYRVGVVAGVAVLAAGAIAVPGVLASSRAGGLGAGGPGAPSACPTLTPPPPVPSESLGVVAGPTWDPSVPDASRQPTADPPATVDSSPSAPASAAGSPVTAGSQDLMPAPTRMVCPDPEGPVPCVWLPSTGEPAVSQSVGNLSPAPLPSEGCPIAAARLNAALAGELHTLLPGWSPSGTGPGRSPFTFRRTVGGADPNGYLIEVNLTKGSQALHLVVSVDPHQPENLDTLCQRISSDPDTTCAKAADGSVVITIAPPATKTSGTYQISDVRPDGTTVVVMGGAPATREQLTAIARAPELTLFP